MNFFGIFGSPQKGSANLAKERLQQVLANDRRIALPPDFLPILQAELMEVIARYVRNDGRNVSMEVMYAEGESVLEVNVVLQIKHTPIN